MQTNKFSYGGLNTAFISASDALSALLSQATQAEPRTSTEPRRGKR